MKEKTSLIVGVIGHIDHGKTSVVNSLNGFDGDSSKEEKDRGITLDLSYSNLNIDDEINIAFIDVPGHQKLVRHMIAGAFGFDLAMVVIDAKEGIMPQTLEHLKIAIGLNLKNFIIVLSKKDLVSTEFLEFRILEIKELSKELGFEIIEIVPYSTLDTTSRSKLLAVLKTLKSPIRNDKGYFLLYVNRAFSAKGVGEICIGTIISGKVKTGDNIYCYDLGKVCKAKSLQVHNTKVEEAHIGQRCALNLSGINANEVKRGFLLGQKGVLRGFDCIDIMLEEGHNLTHHYDTKAYIGAKEVSAKIQLLSQNFATLILSEKIFAIFNQKIILKDDKKLAIATILNPITDPIKKRQKVVLLNHLKDGKIADAFLLLSQIHSRGFGLLQAMQRFDTRSIDAIELAKKASEICQSQSGQKLIIDEENFVIYHPSCLEKLQNDIELIFTTNKNAILTPNSLINRFSFASEYLLKTALEDLKLEGKITLKDNMYINKNNINSPLDFTKNAVEEYFKKALYAPLAPQNLALEMDIDEMLLNKCIKELIASKKLIKIAHNIYLDSINATKLLALMREVINVNGFIDFQLLKAKLPISRKYLIAFLDYLDKFSDIQNKDNVRSKSIK